MKVIHTDMGDIYTWDKLTPEMEEVHAVNVAERQKQRAVIADLQSQLDAIKTHQAEVRAQFERRYAALILRVNKAEREAAKWHGIAIGAIEEVTE